MVAGLLTGGASVYVQVGVGAIAAGIQRFGVDNYEMAYEGRKEFSSAGEYATDIAFGAAFGVVFGAAGRFGGAARATVIAEGRNFGTGLRGLGNQAKFEAQSLAKTAQRAIATEKELLKGEISSVKNGISKFLNDESGSLKLGKPKYETKPLEPGFEGEQFGEVFGTKVKY